MLEHTGQALGFAPRSFKEHVILMQTPKSRIHVARTPTCMEEKSEFWVGD